MRVVDGEIEARLRGESPEERRVILHRVRREHAEA
jgi:hypothetical protein